MKLVEAGSILRLLFDHEGRCSPKCQAVSKDHGVTTQKTIFFIATTVRSSELSYCLIALTSTAVSRFHDGERRDHTVDP
jgi:hypothetical protein